MDYKLATRNNPVFHFAILILLLMAMNYYIFFYFPPSEGWWQTYAYLLNNGMKPYVDFDMAFPPLFIYFTSILNKISNYFIVYRIIGIVQVVLIFILLSQILRKFYSVNIALIASFLGVSLMMNSYHFTPNDYHTFVNLLTVASLYCYLEFKASKSKSPKILFLVITTLCLVATMLVKQNIGLFISLAVITILLIEDYRNSTVYIFILLCELHTDLHRARQPNKPIGRTVLGHYFSK